MSDIRFPDCSKLGNKLEKWGHNLLTWSSSLNVYDDTLFLLKSLITGPSFMPISSLVLELWQFSFIRDWPDIQNLEYPHLILPNIWRLGRIRDTKFGTNISNNMLLNAAKCQCYSMYRFWVIKGKPTGGRG